MLIISFQTMMMMMICSKMCLYVCLEQETDDAFDQENLGILYSSVCVCVCKL